MKYAYPAIFTKEDNTYSVSFPDLEGCYTFGYSIPEAIEMATDALCLVLYDLEETNTQINEPSNIEDITTDSNQFVTMIACDT